jgi:hypothetical protein
MDTDLFDDPASCGFAQHDPPPAIAFMPGLWFWRCKACLLTRILPIPRTATEC